jgi:hypothetical protein
MIRLMVLLCRKQQICTCTPNLYTVCINAGLQCAFYTRTIYTNNTIIKNLFEKCVGPEKVDIIGGICGYSIAKTKPKSFFNVIVEAPVSILVEVNSVSVEVFLFKEFVGKEKKMSFPALKC